MKKETQLKLRTIIREEYQKLLIERLKIENKDWEQMAKLINTRKNGDNIASAIKNKDRAIACFICGHKLDKLSNTNYNEKYIVHSGISIEHISTVNIPIFKYKDIFTKSGEYLLLLCEAGKECVSGVNTNSIPVYVNIQEITPPITCEISDVYTIEKSRNKFKAKSYGYYYKGNVKSLHGNKIYCHHL